MSKRTRTLKKENDRASERMTASNRQVLADMMLYIGRFDISAYEREKVRCDIIRMILEGEKRGETALTIIGKDFHAFCDSVVQELPRVTIFEKVLLFFRDLCGTLSLLSVLYGGLYLALSAGYGDLKSVRPAYIIVSLGTAVRCFIIVVAVTWITGIFCRNPYKSRLAEYMRILLSGGILILITFCAASVLKQPLFSIPCILLVPAAAVLFIIYRILDSRVG